MITIRRAVPGDAPEIARVQVTTWRDTYPSILPARYLVGMSLARITARWRAVLSSSDTTTGLFVAQAAGAQIVGYGSCGPRRSNRLSQARGEVYEVYVTPAAQGQGIGRALLAAMAEHFIANDLGPALVWVLKDNPSRWFYQRLGARLCAEEVLRFAGVPLVQLAYIWPDAAGLERLAQSPPGRTTA